MLKVLHSYKVYPPDSDGGVPAIIASLTRATGSIIHNVLIARSCGRYRRYKLHDVPIEAAASLGTLFSTPLSPSFPLLLLRRARSTDILVHHAPFPLVDVVSELLPKNIGLIVFWHADIVGFDGLRVLLDPLIERTLLRADQIVVSDLTVLEDSLALKPFRTKCIVVPFGVDTQFWGTLTPAEQSAVSLLRRQRPRMIVSVGRLVPYKGYDVLLRAMASLDAELVVIGEGPLHNALVQSAHRAAIDGKVTFAGRLSQSEIKSYLHAARVLAFPSTTRAEAFGLVQLEAMAAGLPVVNTALATAVPRIARHQKEALTVPPNDSQALADALRQILDNSALGERLGASGRFRSQSTFSLEKFYSRMQHIYEDVALQKRKGV
jgi:rhamnosyl/mannosyltransferase